MADETRANVPVAGAVNANQLRRMAEWADGVRGKNFVISMNAKRPDGTFGLGLKPLADGEAPKENEIPVHTEVAVKNKLVPREIVVRHPDANVAPILVPVGEYDALLWGEVSAEKFLVPYYVRFFSDEQMAKLRTAISSTSVIAFLHTYPTDFLTMDTRIEPKLLVADVHGFVEGGFISLSDWTP